MSNVNDASIPKKFRGKRPAIIETEFAIYDRLPKPIRDAVKESPLDWDMTQAWKQWRKNQKLGVPPETFASLYRQSDKFLTQQLARETYGPSHPQAKG